MEGSPRPTSCDSGDSLHSNALVNAETEPITAPDEPTSVDTTSVVNAPQNNPQTTTNTANVLTPDDSTDTTSPPIENLGPPRPFVSYPRRTLLHLSKSPLVQPPEGMPELKDWFGEWVDYHHSRKDADHNSSGAIAAGRHRLRREQTDDGESRPAFKSQFSQGSQMGNFRHHSSRLDEKGDRDNGHSTLKNLSDRYDRGDRLLGSSSLGTRREGAPHMARSVSGISANGPASGTGKRELDPSVRETLADKRRESNRAEKSDDWRRGPLGDNVDEEGFITTERSSNRDRNHRPARLRSRSRDGSSSALPAPPLSSRRESYRDRERDSAGPRDERDWERRRRGNSRERGDKDKDASTSPVLPASARWGASRGWNSSNTNATEPTETSRRPRGASNAADEEPNYRRRGTRETTNVERDRNVGDLRLPKERKDREPAWMSDLPEEPKPGSGILGGRDVADGLDDLQAWKLKEKEKERLAAEEKALEPATDTSIDDFARFQLRIKQEAQKRETAARSGSDLSSPPSSLPPPPPGLPSIPTTTSTAETMKSEQDALAALLSPLGISATSTQPTRPTVTTDFNATTLPTSITTNDLLNPSSTLSTKPPTSTDAGAQSTTPARYPELSHSRQAPSLSTPVSVTASSPDPNVRSGTPLSTTSAINGHPLINGTGGRSTPSTGFAHVAIDGARSVSGSSAHSASVPPPSQPTMYSSTGEALGSPGSGTAQPSYAQGKGSRFAKFWSDKPKDSASPGPATPAAGTPLASTPVAPLSQTQLGTQQPLASNPSSQLAQSVTLNQLLPSALPTAPLSRSDPMVWPLMEPLRSASLLPSQGQVNALPRDTERDQFQLQQQQSQPIRPLSRPSGQSAPLQTGRGPNGSISGDIMGGSVNLGGAFSHLSLGNGPNALPSTAYDREREREMILLREREREYERERERELARDRERERIARNAANRNEEQVQNLLSMLSAPRPASRSQDQLNQLYRQQQQQQQQGFHSQDRGILQQPPSTIFNQSQQSHHQPLALHQNQFQQQQSLAQQQLGFSPLASPDLESRFTPDGMVPGLRPHRTNGSRETTLLSQINSIASASSNTMQLHHPHEGAPSSHSSTSWDDEGRGQPQFNVPRMPSHQQAFDQLHSRPIPPLYSNQAPGGAGVNLPARAMGGGNNFGINGMHRQSPNPLQQHRGSFVGGNVNIVQQRHGGGLDSSFGGVVPQHLTGGGGGFTNPNANPMLANRSVSLPQQSLNGGGGGFSQNQLVQQQQEFILQQQRERELLARQQQQMLNMQQQQQLRGVSGGRMLPQQHHAQQAQQPPPQVRHLQQLQQQLQHSGTPQGGFTNHQQQMMLSQQQQQHFPPQQPHLAGGHGGMGNDFGGPSSHHLNFPPQQAGFGGGGMNATNQNDLLGILNGLRHHE